MFGYKQSTKEQQLASFKETIARSVPGVRVSGSILRFCGLHSSHSLSQHYQNRKTVTEAHAAGWTKSLVEKLAGLTSSPRLAGLGALAVAIFIDFISFSQTEESMKEALRSVFAEEKASDVWDQIDNCITRCVVNINDVDRLKSDLLRIEERLSFALTKLKNSTLRDGQMSSRALKAWVNGAAFHIQVLIHLVRIGGSRSCDPVERQLSLYQRDVNLLFTQHRAMLLQQQCSISVDLFMVVPRGCFPPPPRHYFINEEKQRLYMEQLLLPEGLEAYLGWYDGQKREIEQHFSDVRQNLQKLVTQPGSLTLT